MKDDEKAAYESQLAAEQTAKEAAEKAAAEAAAASQSGESETQKPEDTEKETKKTNFAPVLIIIVLMAAAGGGWFFMQTKKKKKAESAPDPDADYTNEDDEDYGAGPATVTSEPYDDEDPYENEILDDEDSADEGAEDL